MLAYKMTREDMTTRHGFQWEINTPVKIEGEMYLCSNTCLHFYANPLLAALLIPGVNKKYTRCFKAELIGKILITEGKIGCQEAILLEEVKLPKITKDQRREIAITCALEFFQKPYFIEWSNNWLSNKDRSRASARKIRRNYLSDIAARAVGACIYDVDSRTAAVISQALRRNINVQTIIEKVLNKTQKENNAIR
jgi:hypothetical protein